MRKGLQRYRDMGNGKIECVVVNMWTKKETTITINATKDQVENWIDGMLIQDAFPQLTPSERELLLSGTSNDDWNSMFKTED